MTKPDNEPAISQIELERFILGEVTLEEKNKIETAISFDKRLEKKIREIKKSNENFYSRYPADTFLKPVLDNALDVLVNEPNKKPRNNLARFMTAFVPVLALGFGALFLTAFVSLNNKPDEMELATRIKGKETGLTLYYSRDNIIKPVGSASVLRAGDVIQLAYTNFSFKYGIILSIDGRGNVTLHYPSDVTRDNVLKTGKPVYLEYSFELDDAPRFEKFYFIVSDEKINTRQIFQSAALHAKRRNFLDEDLKLPGNIQQVSFIVNKEEK